jgi:glycine cleavage system aminomethyltransferase T
LSTDFNNDVAHESTQAQRPLLNTRGIVDDVIFYRLSQIMICADLTATRILLAQGHAAGQVEIRNESARYAQLALQGPLAENLAT